MAHGVSIAQPAPSLQLDAEAEPQEAAPQAIEPVGAIETHESTPAAAPLRPATPPPTEAPASPSPTTTRRPPRPTTAAQEEEESSDEEEVFLLFLCVLGVD